MLFSALAIGLMTQSVGILGCASTGATPGWVNGEAPAEFPKDKFVSALSTGATLGSAQVAAKAELYNE